MGKNTVYAVLLSALLVGCGGGDSQPKETSPVAKATGKGENIELEKMLYTENKKNMEAYQRYRVKIENDPSIEKKIITGKLFHGYVESARICLDLNKNNLCDYNEPLTTSNNKGEFELKVPLIETTKTKLENEPIMILASRGVDINTNRKYMAFLKAPSPESEAKLSLTPLGTLALTQLDGETDKGVFSTKLAQKKEALKTLTGVTDIFDGSSSSFKENLKVQKISQLLSTGLGSTDEKATLESLKKTYEAFSLSKTTYPELIDSVQDSKLKKATQEAKKIANAIEKVDLTDKGQRESISVLVDGKVQEAQIHFRNSNQDFTSSDIDTTNLQDEAIRLRIKQIGLSNVTADMIKAVKDGGLSLSELEDIKKIENIPALKPIADLLKKKANATSKLFILKSLISGDFTELKIYFSHPLNKESQRKLTSKEDVKSVYTISGLTYELSSSTYDETENVNTLTFKAPAKLQANAQIYINELTLADSGDVYSRPSPQPTNIETPRYLPTTGQVHVWSKYDDGSFGYGADLKYQKTAAGLSSDVANLQWQDISFVKGINDVLTFAEAKKYCEGATTYGFSDWRLPNVKEAVSATSLNSNISYFSEYPISELIHVYTQNTSLDRTMAVQRDGQVANLVTVKDDFWGRVDGKYGVRCVRDINSGSMYPHKAHDNIILHVKDQTSYDPALRLMFQDVPYTAQEEDALKNYQNLGKHGDLNHAIAQCQSLNTDKFGGFENWRLPNANELFYSLDGTGRETFQNKIPPYGYYITSSTSYVAGVGMSWFTGNYYVRKYLDSRTQGFIRCVRDMDEATLKEAKAVNAPANENVTRRYTVKADKTVDITVPAEIFSQYTGIRLTQTPDGNLTSIQYEITNMLDPDENFPAYKIISLTKNGEVVDPKEDGYFDFWVERYLVGNNYGKRAFKEGDKLKLVVNNRLYDVTINMTIGKNTNEADSNATTPVVVEAKAPTLKSPEVGTIKVSQSSGNRIKYSNRNILYFVSKGLKERKEYNIVETEGSPKIKSFSIVRGNEDGVFEFVQNITNKQFELRVKESKIATLTPKLYTLHVKADNGKMSNEVEIKVEVVKIQPPVLKQNISLNLSNSPVESSWSDKVADGRFVLFEIVHFEPGRFDKHKARLIQEDNGFEPKSVVYAGSSENYEIVSFGHPQLIKYAIVVKDGKKRANEDLEVTVTAIAKNGEKVTAKTTIKITGAKDNEEIVSIGKPEFKQTSIEREVTDAANNNQNLGGDIIDMKTYTKDTVLTIAPAGIIKVGAMLSDIKPQFYLSVQDKSQLTKEVFSEADTTKTFTITATNAKGSSELEVKVKLIIAEQPELKPLAAPIEIYPASGDRADNNSVLLSVDPKKITDDKYNIIKALGVPKMKDLIIVSGNEEGLFEYKKSWIPTFDIKVNKEKVSELVENKTYTLKVKGTNGDLETNTIDIQIKVLEQIAPILKADVNASLAEKQKPSSYSGKYGDKTADDKPILFRFGDSSRYYKWRVDLIDSPSGFRSDDISFELQTPSANYEIVSYESSRSKYYGIVLKDGGSEVPEDLTIKVIGTYGDGKTKSATTTLKIVE